MRGLVVVMSLIMVIGLVEIGIAQEEAGYKPRPSVYRGCPFCGSSMAWLISKYKQRHLTEQYQDLRLEFQWPLKKSS